MIDQLLFGAYPYLALALLVAFSIQRRRRERFSAARRPAELVETKGLFWGSLACHFGLAVLFFGHLIGFLIPRQVMAVTAEPLRLLVIEGVALTAALLSLTGLTILTLRRFRNAELRAQTSGVDVFVHVLLLVQIITGIWIAVGYRWGTAWYTQVIAPYLQSLCLLRPDIKQVVLLPHVAKLHVLGAFTLLIFFSFSRLIHMLVAPVPYLWMSSQVQKWSERRQSPGKPAEREAAR